MTPLSNMENSVEASTWARRSQEKQGHNGTLTPKPQDRRKVVTKPTWLKPRSAKEKNPRKKRDKKPTKRPKLPNKVQKAISATASSIRSDLEVSLSKKREAMSKSSKLTKKTRREEVKIKLTPADKIREKVKMTAGKAFCCLVTRRKKKTKDGKTKAKRVACCQTNKREWTPVESRRKGST